MASAGARAYKGGLGAEPPAESRGRAPGQGVWGAKPPPPEAESLFVFGRLIMQYFADNCMTLSEIEITR